MLARQGDQRGEVQVKTAMLAAASEFFDSVGDEILSLIGEHDPEPPAKERPRTDGAIVGSEGRIPT